MSDFEWNDEQLRAFFDEQLAAEEMSRIEEQLRRDESLRARLANLSRGRDNGNHSLGDIWRRNRLSCPNREQWGSYLLDVLDADERDYLEFHLQTIGCRYCLANLRDLEAAAGRDTERGQRRRRLFESSAGYLRGSRQPDEQ